MESPAPTGEADLAPDLPRRINAQRRAADDLPVDQIYRYDNSLLAWPRARSDVKALVGGHEGSTAGQNLIYVHLMHTTKRCDLDISESPCPAIAVDPSTCVNRADGTSNPSSQVSGRVIAADGAVAMAAPPARRADGVGHFDAPLDDIGPSERARGDVTRTAPPRMNRCARRALPRLQPPVQSCGFLWGLGVPTRVLPR